MEYIYVPLVLFLAVNEWGDFISMHYILKNENNFLFIGEQEEKCDRQQQLQRKKKSEEKTRGEKERALFHTMLLTLTAVYIRQLQ